VGTRSAVAKSVKIKSTGPANGFTTRLLKGGALLADMRQMVCQWSDDLGGEKALDAANRILHKSTRVRVADTLNVAFKPRFIAGNPPDAWKLARIIEDCHPPIEVVRPFYYWITARAEPILHRFVTTELFERTKSADREIRINETTTWVSQAAEEESKVWAPTVRQRMARCIHSALRDFGILEGVIRKRIAPQHLALEAFCLIAFCLHELGFEQKSLVRHPDWKLFLLPQTAVERLFLEAHQNGWLDYQCIGEIYRIEFKSQNLDDYAHDLLGR
jgi:hypothetical protein